MPITVLSISQESVPFGLDSPTESGIILIPQKTWAFSQMHGETVVGPGWKLTHATVPLATMCPQGDKLGQATFHATPTEVFSAHCV